MALSLGIEPRTWPPEGHVISISPREQHLSGANNNHIQTQILVIVVYMLNLWSKTRKKTSHRAKFTIFNYA